jgi:tetratricopeptide (TPR) repeat protein
VICAPSAGKNCPACESNSGAYTIAAGETLRLRHRFYFHHGDALTGNIAEQYEAYTADAESVLLRMRALHQDRKWGELIEQFGERDFASSWPAESASQALQLRGQIYSFTKDGERADADLQAALKLVPDNMAIWLILAENCVRNLNDDDRAIDAYRKVISITGQNNKGWQPLTATVGLARLYTDRVKLDEALAVLEPYGDLSETADSWRIRLLRCRGHIHTARGDEEAALASFREALELEAKP